jgi:hypothetical protein
MKYDLVINANNGENGNSMAARICFGCENLNECTETLDQDPYHSILNIKIL